MAVEKEVIQGLLQEYWKDRFPENPLKTDVLYRNKQLELIAELPSVVENTPKMLKEIEEEIGGLLVKQLGYKKGFLFTFLITH